MVNVNGIRMSFFKPTNTLHTVMYVSQQPGPQCLQVGEETTGKPGLYLVAHWCCCVCGRLNSRYTRGGLVYLLFTDYPGAQQSINEACRVRTEQDGE